VSKAVSSIKNFKSTMQLASGGIRTLENNLKTAKTAVAAARAELERLKASKAAAPEIEKAAANLRLLENNARNAEREVKRAREQLNALGTTAMRAGEILNDAGNKLTVGLTLPILAMGAASLKLATDFEETKNKSIVVFDELSDSILENADKADRALGMSAENYLDYASAIGAALKAGGMGVAETAALSEKAIQHFADLASFHNAQVNDVSDAWQSAIRGQYEPIQRYFPFINDAYMKTYGAAQNLIDGTTKNLTANQRAIILNAIALDSQLNPAMNDFANTSGGLANQTRIAQAQLENMMRQLGTNLLPIALEVTTALNGLLEKFNQLSPETQQSIVTFLGFAAVLGPVVKVISSLLTVFGWLTTSWPMIAKGAGMAKGAIAGLSTFVSGSAGPALAGLAAGAKAAFAAVAGGAATLGGLVASAAMVIAPLLLIAATLFFVYAAFKQNLWGITTTAEQLWFIIKHYFSEGWKWLLKSVSDGASKVSDWFGRLRDNIVKIFRIDWGMIGRSIIAGMISGIASKISELVSTVQRAARAAFEAAKKVLDARSPSRKFGWLGQMSAIGYMKDFAKTMNPAELARVMTRPFQQTVSRTSQQNNTFQFSSGLSMREARQMQRDTERKTMKKTVDLFAGA
jgi:hypothetical protein